VTWGALPAGTAEVALLVVHIGNKSFAFDWALAGVKPELHGLPAGSVPAGAVVGRNSAGRSGYSVCPPMGTTVRYGIFVFALAHKTQLAAGFDPRTLVKQAAQAPTAQGTREFSYRRR
jgi:phosphatidylethanolamine-binding protein (PEBP) family uncharacterized protein